MARALGSQYVLESVLGRGGFGEVWQGHDREGSLFAFKVMHPTFSSDPRAVENFVRERTIVLGLDHPNLVRVRDMVVEGDTLALVMDLVNGGDLRSALRRFGPMSVQDGCEVASGVARALHELHTHGIVHRDVKPENVLLDASGPEIVARLTDFGISRISVSGSTATVFSGTPTYVAPEQFDDVPPTSAADIYSLGVMIHEMLTGRPPFVADSVLALMRMHLDHKPPPLTGVPAELTVLVGGMLSKVAADRPTSEAAIDILHQVGGVGRAAPDLTMRRPLVAERAAEQTVRRLRVPPPAVEPAPPSAMHPSVLSESPDPTRWSIDPIEATARAASDMKLARRILQARHRRGGDAS